MQLSTLQVITQVCINGKSQLNMSKALNSPPPSAAVMRPHGMQAVCLEKYV